MKLPQFLIRGNRETPEDDKIAEQTSSKEELDAIQFQQRPKSLPSLWRGADGKTHLGQDVRVVTPTPDEIARLGQGGDTFICGYCKYFELEEGRKEMARQRFGERLVHDYEWKLRHLGSLDTVGLCGASGGETATHYISKGCDQYRLDPRFRARGS